MATISEALAIAVQHHQGGRLQAAEQIYRQILQAEPNQADAIHLLGVIAHQMGRHEVAVEYIERAIGLKGNTAAFHANLGAAYFALHRIPQAVACYRRAVELKPDFAEAHGNLGNLLRELGNLDEAVVCYRRAVELMPDVAAAHNNLGNALFDQGKPDEAIECFRRALELKPEFAEAHNSLGAAIKNLGKLDEAVACYRRALELNPDYAAVHSNLGTVLKDQGKLDEAIVCYRRALALNPDFAEAHNNLGIAFKDQGKLEEAVVCCRRALALKSDYAEAHSNLGIALKEQGKLDEAIACFRRALELKPDFPTFLDNLLRPLQDTCCWKDLKALSARLIEIVDRYGDSGIPFSVPPFTFLTLPTITTAEQQLRYARNWVDRQLKAIGEPVDNLARHRPSKPKSKITIAYLSADFHSHATAWLIAEMIEKHDRDRFAVLGYSFGPDDRSPTRRRLVEAFDRFVDVKDTSFMGAAQRLFNDGVDILVDLKGYTKDARTEILSLRPAPIQVNYLGYPGTMGAEFIDYILVDDYVVPSDQHPFFTEKLVYLPGCYQVNDSRREISGRTPSREECKLPADGFVFCSFNNNYKDTPAMFEVWMRLLKAVPGSVLWFLAGNPFVSANLQKEAEACGVAAQRLVAASRLPLPEHLARHRLADLFLDSFPYNAHTTTSDALWAGLPVLTLAGRTFASRVAGSLLRTIGLPELITTSLEDYEAMALRLARNPGLLADLRTRLESNRKTCGLFDGGQFARNIEKAYVAMWEIYMAGEKPRAFTVSPT